MPDPVTGILGGASIIGGISSSRASSRAADAQVESNDAAIAEQRAARLRAEQLLQPYAQAGTPALQQLMAIAGIGGQGGGTDWNAYAQSNPELMAAYNAQNRFGGLGARFEGDPEAGQFFGLSQPQSLDQFAQQYYNQNGGDISQYQGGGADAAQAAAIAQQENSPFFQSLVARGEDAILQNASATGGLRGGNTQAALAQFRPEMLNRFIEQQYGRLSGIASLGQNAAAGSGNIGLQTAANTGNILMNSGAARAGNSIAQGNAFNNAIGGLGGVLAGRF